MKRTKIEKLILAIAWIGLVGGILFGLLFCKGLIESGADMCVPQAIVYLVAFIFVSVGCWAILLEIINISDGIRKLNDKLTSYIDEEHKNKEKV